ncbi:hypothetical protein MXMO3_02939 [Maritalea myrionectae]|uniref:Serine aminopeptidase S33 domain-containing protein n=1 Tax=Maritalea myrionectae TaxID=454601 RepID=A0A2R4MH96_9HYPH|nr:hypothetical protein [Maritalea myrionectae]AVX05447.1 hypothetical protein MXMO3_02939 [Maritalea myrionectae]
MPEIEVISTHEHIIKFEASVPMAQITRAAIIYPGLAYTANHPILKFATLCCAQNGFTPVLASYEYRGVFEGKSEEHIQQILADDARQIEAALDCHLVHATDRLLLGKSLGCFLIAHMNEAMGRADGIAWFTPNISYMPIWAAIKRHKKSFVGLGKLDKYFSHRLAENVAKHPGISLSLQPDLDHGLEAADDVEKTISQQGAMIADLNHWFDTPSQKPNDLL